MKPFTLSTVLASLPILIPSAFAQSASSSSSAAAQSSSAAAYSTTIVVDSSTILSLSTLSTSTLSSAVPSSTVPLITPSSILLSSTIISSSLSSLAPTVASSTVFIASSSSAYLSSSYVVPIPQPSITPVGNYIFAGCYLEPQNGRALTYLISAADNMTPEVCSTSCAGQYQYFGLEFGRECWCGSTLGVGTNKTTQDQCNMPCGGSSNEMCGAGNIISLYSSLRPIAPPPTPNAPSNVGGYSALGCYTEAANYQRALTGLEVVSPNMTNEMCATACSGSLFFGTEYSNECYCGNALGAGAVPTAATDCFMPCSGSSSESCGGPNRLDLYFIIDGVLPPPLPVSSSSRSKSSSLTVVVVPSSSASVKLSSTSPAPTLSSVSPSNSATKFSTTIASTSVKTTSSSLSTQFTTSTKSTFLTVKSTSTSSTHPSGTWASVGCFQDTAKHLMTVIANGRTMNVEVCIAAAAAAATAKKPVKYLYIGLENGQTCYGATAAPTATSLIGPAACTVTCAGNKAGAPVKTCGGKLQYNMYASV